MIFKNKIQKHVKRIIPIHMLKDIKEKYNTRALPRIQDTLVTKGATNKNFYHEEKLLLCDYGDEEFHNHIAYIVNHKISLDLRA
jgi:hypothetical protein